MTKYKFLIVEDDFGTRELLRTLLLKNFSCEIKEAENGKMGLDILKSFIPHLIFLDISMPVLDGNEMLKIIRGDSGLSSIQVMILTALGDKDTVNMLIAQGVTEYILKPLDFDITVGRVRNLLSSMNLPDAGDKSTAENHQKLLLIEKDDGATNQLKSGLTRKFEIHSAESGSEALKIFASFQHKIILINDNIGLLDKKIIFQRIPELSGGGKIYFYLLIDPYKPLTSKVFNYDGVIKKNANAESVLNELVKLSQNTQSSFDNMRRIFDKHFSNIQNSFKKVFEEITGQKISLAEIPETQCSEKILSILFLSESLNDVRLNYGIFVCEKDINSIRTKINNTDISALSATDLFKSLFERLHESIQLIFQTDNINLSMNPPVEIIHGEKFPSGDWNCELNFKTGEEQLIKIKFSISRRND